jgi:putative holliday junction resolvase
MTLPSFPILGIDYGEQNLGLAIAFDRLAEPVAVVPTGRALPHIQQLIAKHGIQTLLLGLSENQMAQKTKSYGAMLTKQTSLPVIYHDETLSSYDTRVNVAKGGMSKKKREAKLDHYAATTILQDYLDGLNF